MDIGRVGSGRQISYPRRRDDLTMVRAVLKLGLWRRSIRGKELSYDSLTTGLEFFSPGG